MKKTFYLLVLMLLFSATTEAQIITTIAGLGNFGYNGDGIAATMARLYDPTGVAVDAYNNVYIAELNGFRIRKIDHLTGLISTLAGTGVAGYSADNIAATAATIDSADCIAVDDIGNVYISDGGSSRIRKVDTSGIITTIAGTGVAGYSGDNGIATLAKLNRPSGVAVDKSGNVFIADGYNHRARKVDKAGIITTVAGTGIYGYSGDNGSATAANLYAPGRVSIDKHGNLYLGELHRIRKVDTFGIITTIVGIGISGYSGDMGPATNAEIGNVGTVAIDANQNLYFEDSWYNTIRKIDNTGIITTFAGIPMHPGYNGDNIEATNANLCTPLGVAVDNSGSLYIADDDNGRIRYIKNTTGLNDINENETNIEVLPNPSNGTFITKLNENKTEAIKVIVINVFGEKIIEVNTYSNKDIELTINETGVYALYIITKADKLFRKISIIK